MANIRNFASPAEHWKSQPTLPKRLQEEHKKKRHEAYRVYGIFKKFSCQRLKASDILRVLDSPIAQSVERRTVNPQVAGSSPARGAKQIGESDLPANSKYSPIAQSVERRTVNPQVAGSSPARGATNSKSGAFARRRRFFSSLQCAARLRLRAWISH